MRLRISHESTYNYDQPIPFGLQQVRLTPLSYRGQNVVEWDTTVKGASKELEYVDHNMNHVELVSFAEGQTEIQISANGIVETSDSAGVMAPGKQVCPSWVFQRTTELTTPGPRLNDLIAPLVDPTQDTVEQLHELSRLIIETVDYRTGNTHAESTVEEVLGVGSGVCQDHAHVFISGARLLGHPARYVSGYLMMDDRVDQEASHAWAEVLVGSLGWVGFDVSNGISPDERYVRVATGLDYTEAAPISGIRFGGASENLDVRLQVQQ